MVKYSVLKGLYETEKTIGCGGFAKVKLATHVATGEKVAIKIMDKSQLKEDLFRVRLELKALKTLSHKHICKLYQVIETETHFFIVVEYCSGGELFDHIVEKNRLTENESRIFFRQILAAVAYLHDLGYAHRDLKPENVLLDKDQSLKLIDFGLCAKPEGGIQSLLKTSCGSPTYAAPELVMGKEYFGPEVDVWAMGVLLYALLAGFLPFDDQNIDTLYKKILSGKYVVPNFMSKESQQLIAQMLQVDPKRRITVKELLSHPWVTLGVLDPVEIRAQNIKHQDDDCIALMAQYNGVTPTDMWRHLKKWRYDYHTATYLLLIARKKRSMRLKLNPAALKVPVMSKSVDATPLPKIKTALRPLNLNIKNTLEQAVSSSPKDNSPLTPSLPKSPFTPKTPLNTPQFDSENVDPFSPNIDSPNNFTEPRKPSSIRKPQKRIRSPTLDGEYSPVPSKRSTPGSRSTPKTPDRKRTPSVAETPGSARRMLDSIEKSFNIVRHVLTPKRQVVDATCQPQILTAKDLCNVSTTECSDPEIVIGKLIRALESRGICCKRKGFTLRGKMEPNNSIRMGGCSFELEICYIPAIGIPQTTSETATPTKSILKNGALNGKLNCDGSSSRYGSIGIRRKRLKGDSWCYKNVCEQVLALTTLELKRPAESSV